LTTHNSVAELELRNANKPPLPNKAAPPPKLLGTNRQSQELVPEEKPGTNKFVQASENLKRSSVEGLRRPSSNLVD
jgi:hypothetical protein